MNTVQKYSGEGDRTTSPTQTAQNAAHSSSAADNRPAPIAIGEFIARYTPQDELTPGQTALFLDHLLTHQPIQYTSILDAIPLLRTFLPAVGTDADYALLIQDQSIVGFAWLGSGSYEEATSIDARLLMKVILALDIKTIVLATTYSVQGSAFDDTRISDIECVGEAFTQFGVSLNDWLHIHPAHTESYMQAAYGEESIDLTEDQVNFCYDGCTFPDHSDEEEEESEQAIVLSAVVDHRPQVANLLNRSQEMAQLDMLLVNNHITNDQHSWSEIVPVPDNSMAPALVIGGYLVAYLLDPTEYIGRVGKVVTVRLVVSPGTYQIGRLKSVDSKSLTLAYDSADVADLVLPLSDVNQLCEGIYSFGNPVL